jgi:predicted transcriptional regulator
MNLLALFYLTVLGCQANNCRHKENICLQFLKDLIMIKIMDGYGKKIEKERERQGLTRDQLVEMSKVSRRTLQNVENGKGCTVETLIKLAGGLKVHPAIFLS